MKLDMIAMRGRGITFVEIGKRFGVAASTVAYHTDEGCKKQTIARAMKNRKPQTAKQKEGTRKYNKEYQSNRYKNDPEFREKCQAANRENQKKKYWEKHESNNLP